MIAFNAVYQNEDSGERVRIIDISPEDGICAYISMNGDRVLPVLCAIQDMVNKLDSNELIEVVDPYYEVSIPDKYSETDIKCCEDRYRLVTKYWPEQKAKLLKKSGRIEFLKYIASQEDVTEATLRRLFCQFWQHGMRKSAMFTSYTNSGGKGKKRALQKKNGIKRNDGVEGLLIDEKIEHIFDTVIKKYYETEKQPSLTKVYYQMLDSYFSKEINIGGTINKVLYDENHYPTFRQFQYYVNCHLDKTEAYIARMSESKYKLKRRPLSDTATNQIYGPGDCFMIDSTPADIYLVSKSNSNKVIGRPTVYIVIDVYSRLITGFYTGLENPSWDAVSLSLQNMVEDKVEFCKGHDIDINIDEWPSHHLPKAILADRGDMISKRAGGIINELGVIILNAAPYRGDMKGVVERFFRTMNNHLKQTLPGGIHKDHLQRGDNDPRLDAALTLDEFQKVIIQTILLHNASTIKDYPATPEQITDGIASIPVDLWEYGIEHRTGNLRSVDTEMMALNLWPRDTASLTRKGLRFQDLFYGDIRLAQKASGLEKTMKMKVIYNPFTVNYIYVLDGTYRKVYLQPGSSDFENMSFAEYKDFKQTGNDNNATTKSNRNQRKAAYEGMLMDTAKKAEQRRNALPKTTKAARKQNTRVERNNEKAEERRERTKELVLEVPARVIPINKSPQKDYMERMKDETASLMDNLFGDED